MQPSNRLLIAVSFIFLLLVGCAKTLPSRQDVIAAIEAHPDTTFYKLRLGNVNERMIAALDHVTRPSFMTDYREGRIPEWQEYLDIWTELDSKKYISVTHLGQKQLGLYVGESYDIQLADPGREIFRIDRRVGGEYGIGDAVEYFAIAPIYAPDVQEITEISELDENRVLVKYTWSYEPVSPIASIVKPLSEMRTVDPNEIHEGEVRLSKSEEGWVHDQYKAGIVEYTLP